MTFSKYSVTVVFVVEDDVEVDDDELERGEAVIFAVV